MRHVSPFPFPVLAVLAAPLAAQQSLPPLPDTTGFGVHVLAIARAPDQSLWVGTYGQGIFVLRQGAGSWEQLKHSSDTTARSISFSCRSEEHTSELQSPDHLVCRLLLEKKKKNT